MSTCPRSQHRSAGSTGPGVSPGSGAASPCGRTQEDQEPELPKLARKKPHRLRMRRRPVRSGAGLQGYAARDVSQHSRVSEMGQGWRLPEQDHGAQRALERGNNSQLPHLSESKMSHDL